MDRFVVFLLCLCLTVGGGVHLYDNVINDLLPYGDVPGWLILYWKSLGPLYLLAAFILILYRRTGLILMLVILLTNVTFSPDAYYTLDTVSNHGAMHLKTLFLGFSIGVSLWLWNTGQSQQPRQIFH